MNQYETTHNDLLVCCPRSHHPSNVFSFFRGLLLICVLGNERRFHEGPYLSVSIDPEIGCRVGWLDSQNPLDLFRLITLVYVSFLYFSDYDVQGIYIYVSPKYETKTTAWNAAEMNHSLL